MLTHDKTAAPSNAANQALLLGGRTTRFFSIPRLSLVLIALASATISFGILLGLTPIKPEPNVIFAAVVVNSIFVLLLLILIASEVATLFKARRRGKAAAKLHIRIVGLFSVVAIAPAILVAVIATITLDVGLDRWFSIRTKAIVQSSLEVAQAYVLENARFLQGQTVSMANDLDNARTLYNLDRTGFQQLLSRQAQGRGLLGAQIVSLNGDIILEAELDTNLKMPAMPEGVLETASDGLPALIPPGSTNLVGAVLRLRNISGVYLYTVRTVDDKVVVAMRQMEAATNEFNNLEAGRSNLQIAFAVLFIGFALILLLAAIWTAIAVADRLVRPIRRLIAAADTVAQGQLDISVPVHTSDGDVGSLARTFNKMITQIKTQRDEILGAKDVIDDRRRFTEAVLTGVSAGVVGIDFDGNITIANKSAAEILNREIDNLVGKNIQEVAPDFGPVFIDAGLRENDEFRSQVTLSNQGKEHTLDVKITREEGTDGLPSYVVTVDDITDLVIAQRSSAWADVARRIAHEIKNPLTPIQLSTERIKRRFGKFIPQDDRKIFDQCTETIIRQVGDIGNMVNEFSSFARMPKPSKTKQDLREIIKDSVFLREVSRSDISFTQDVPEESLIGDFDARMLGQALGNLVKNATEAIDSLESDQVRNGRRVHVKAYVEDGGKNYIVDIIDNGKGLPTENRNRLLEPYMTMRDKGTGLGLAIVKKIVEDHNGMLQLHDAPKDFDDGHGAMMRVILPPSETNSDIS